MSADETLDEDAFDALMEALDSPMVIVTTAAGGTRAGCLVGFHAQCGMEPPIYAVWLSKANHTYRVAALADMFAVHFLSAENRALAELFGTTTGNEVDKFAQCSWSPGPGDVPLLDDCPNRIVGRRLAWLDSGADHVCLVIELDHVDHADRAPPFRPLRLSMVDDIEPGHGAEDRPEPAEERARA